MIRFSSVFSRCLGSDLVGFVGLGLRAQQFQIAVASRSRYLGIGIHPTHAIFS